jgi:CRISPR-associated endoribonuclease Cas6
MRLKVEFNSTTENVPNNLKHLNSFIHRILGVDNIYHNKSGDYCISHLCGGKLSKDRLTVSFPNGSPFIIVTSEDMTFMNKIIVGLMDEKNKDYGFGVTFKNMSFINEELYNGWNHFFVLSPILLKGREENDPRYINILTKDESGKHTVPNESYKDRLQKQLVHKFSTIDPTLDFTDFEIVISDKLKRVYKIMDKNVVNTASVFQFSVKTNKKVATMLYNIGVGQSTNSGFGTIYKTESYDLYKF